MGHEIPARLFLNTEGFGSRLRRWPGKAHLLANSLITGAAACADQLILAVVKQARRLRHQPPPTGGARSQKAGKGLSVSITLDAFVMLALEAEVERINRVNIKAGLRRIRPQDAVGEVVSRWAKRKLLGSELKRSA